MVCCIILKVSKTFDTLMFHTSNPLKRERDMSVSATVFLGVILLVFPVFDIVMLVSLIRPGDERNQVIVWKAASFTLLATVGTMMIDIIENFVRAQKMAANPFIQLEVAAIVYFAALMYYKKRHGG